jgi:hypothetical protein
MLKSAVSSSGRERHYEYDGVLMTQITDENRRLLLRNWFRQRFLIRQQFGSGAVFVYSYDWPSDEYYPRKVLVTLPDSTKREVRVADSVPEFVKNYHR